MGHLTTMRLNSEASLQRARSVLRQYGNDWSKMRAAGHLDHNGILVVPSAPAQPTESEPSGAIATSSAD